MIYLYQRRLADILPTDGHQRSLRISSDDRAFIRTHRHGLLSQFCQTWQLPIPEYAIDSHGKPYCTNIAKLSFNQSHSHSHYALIFSLDESDIGVDVENTTRKVRKTELAQHYFSPNEYQLWQQQDCDELLWFKIWTIKEAVLKAHGVGIRLPLNELNACFSDGDKGYVSHKKIGQFYFKNIQVDDALMTVACPNKNMQVMMV